jgi:hypothetical protein
VTRPLLEIADLIRTAGAAFIERNHQWIRWRHVKVLLAIARCRTAALGGHLDECTRCAHRPPISYNSCRNRHCPKCQIAARERWIAARRRELLPTRYLHVVFTLPHYLPEDIEHHLETKWGNLPRHALEALAMEGYRARALSRSQVRRMLAFETGAEVDEFMKRAGVPFDYTLNDRGLVSAMTRSSPL